MRWTQSISTWARFLVTGALLSLSLLAFLVYNGHFSTNAAAYIRKPVSTEDTTQHSAQSCSSNSTAEWIFEVERDGDNHGLSEAQCRSAFPLLFTELEKTSDARKDNPITYNELEELPVEDGMVRAIIDKGELYIVDFGAMPVTFSRGKATLHSLHRALASFPASASLPPIEFIFTTEDYSNPTTSPIWSYSKRDEDTSIWLMPDFGYWSWPEVHIGPYKAIRQRIATVDDSLPFAQKKKQLLWRGAVAPNPDIRGSLLTHTQGRSWASVLAIDWGDAQNLQFNFLPMEDHCRYMFVAHTEGRSFSGRGKYLLNCRSVMVSHRLVWREAHHAAMIQAGPDANFVEVERDFGDLDRKIEFLIDHPEVAERIADNAVKTFRDRYLTPAAESCYWRELVRRYALACEFEPVLVKEDGEFRGTPFETSYSSVLRKSFVPLPYICFSPVSLENVALLIQQVDNKVIFVLRAIFENVSGSKPVTVALVSLMVVLNVVSNAAYIGATVRLIHGFAETGSVPCSSWLAQYYFKYQTPTHVLYLLFVANILLPLLQFASSAILATMVGAAVVLFTMEETATVRDANEVDIKKSA
ncbi:hypothetical protein FE257_011334 [Aspergillus nanangensis]|uniref:Glycosyl transferase CAP10 domain-containing protein n=1 Tax=Aspergillus nanangensis TaxID=2582783 RepID=A0AAD4CJ63_ASPNN|nr:hypothetical protein FE257_011334 [Aspergillus nanangensis]